MFVWSADDLSKRRFVGHTGLVEHAIATHDGRKLITGGLDRAVIIWDLASGEPQLTLRGIPNQVSTLEISADDRTVFVGTFQSLLAFDIESGKRKWRWDGFDDYVTQTVVDPRGRVYIASRKILALDDSSGKVLADWPGHTDFVTALALSKDGRTLVSSASDGSVKAWDTPSGKPKTLLALSPLEVLTLAFTPDEQAVVTGVSDGSIRTVAVRGGQPTLTQIHHGAVLDVEVTPNGTVYSASRDRNVGIHKPGQGPRKILLEGHSGGVRRVLRSRQGQLLSLGDEGVIHIWDPEALTMLARLERRVTLATEPAVHAGDPVGVAEAINGLRYPIEIRAPGGQPTLIAAGGTVKLDGIAIPAGRSCASDDDCGDGEYCDYELDEPVCSGTTIFDAFIPGTETRIWRGEAHLVRDGPVALRIPEDEPFSRTRLAEPSLDPRTRVGAFLKAFDAPSVKRALTTVLGQDADDPETFLSPQIAGQVALALQATEGAPEEAVNLLTTFEQLKLTTNRLPIQPFRIREAAYYLLRPPTPPGKGTVINDAVDTTVILLSIGRLEEAEAVDLTVLMRKEVERLLAEEAPVSGHDYHLVGGLIQDTTFLEYAERDIAWLFPLYNLVLTLMLMAVYRRMSGVMLPLGVVTIAIAATMGISGYFGAALNNMTVAVPQIVLAACIGDSVHIFNGYMDRLRGGMSKHEANVGTIAANWTPCLWTTVSTAIGFISLSWSHIPPVATFGWMAGIGVVVALFMSMTIMPVVMAVLPLPKKWVQAREKNEAVGGADQWIDDRMVALGKYVNRTSGTIVVVGLVFIVVALSGLRKISFDTNAIRFFAKGSPFRVACDMIEAHISGPSNLKLVLDTGEPGGIRKLENIEKLHRLTEKIKSYDEVVGVFSLSDVLMSMNRVMNDNEEDQYRLPDEETELHSYYSAYTMSLPAGMDVSNQVNADESATLIDIRLVDRSSGWMLDWGSEMLTWIDQNLPDTRVTVTGMTWLFSSVLREISRGFFQNVGSAVVLICVMMFLLTRSLRLGIIACFANVIPLACTVGLLSLAEVSLDMSILIACCVAMGIIVDDSIHYLTKYKRLRAKGMDHDDATIGAMRDAGKAMIFTTLILVVSMAMYMLTNFIPNRNIGLAMSIALTTGMLFDLTMLPALLKVFAKDAAAAPTP